MKAERAASYMALARRLEWTIHDVKRMTGWEVRAALDRLQAEELAAKRARAHAKRRAG